jgi:hypothetical protein
MPRLKPGASYSVTIRTENPHTPGTVGRISSAIGAAGGLIAAVDVVRSFPGVQVIDVADRTFHLQLRRQD